MHIKKTFVVQGIIKEFFSLLVIIKNGNLWKIVVFLNTYSRIKTPDR